MLPQELLDILVCPACKGDLEYDLVNQRLSCNACRLRYRIEDDIPIMLIKEAERMGDNGAPSPGQDADAD